MIAAFFLFCVQALSAFPSDLILKADSSPISKGYSLYTGKELIGEVKRKYISLSIDYELFKSNLKAKAQKEIFQFGILYKITNQAGELIGKIEERIYRILPTFDLFSPSGEKWLSGELDFWGNEYTFIDPSSGHVIATLSRPFFRASDDWEAKIHKPELLFSKGIDDDLFYLILGLQGDYQHWSKYPKTGSKAGKLARTKALQELDLTCGDLTCMDEVSAIRDAIYTHPTYIYEQ